MLVDVKKGFKLQRSKGIFVPENLKNKHRYLNGWMDDLRFYVLFNSISVISRRCLEDNERQCAMELRL